MQAIHGSFVVMLVGAAVACQPTPVSLTDAQRRAIVDSVTSGMASYAVALGTLKGDQVTGHYVKGGEFRLVSDGKSYSRADIQNVIDGMAKVARGSEVTWDTIAVTALGPDAALAVAPFHRTDTDTAGKVTRIWGVASWVWVRRDDKWRMLYGHGDHYPDTTAKK